MCKFFMRGTRLAPYEQDMMTTPGFGSRRIAPETPTEISAEQENHIPLREYQFPIGDGYFIGTLVFKRWNHCGGLNCFFDGADGLKYKLCVWNDYAYCPDNSDIDISTLPLGTTLKAKFRETRTGKTRWMEAELMDAPAPVGRACFEE